ncbi:MAG: hypothetical protein JKY65_22915 [Planctomycetes bacterium]|nr:hypothetical protein [Planctomycetota bacterium]
MGDVSRIRFALGLFALLGLGLASSAQAQPAAPSVEAVIELKNEPGGAVLRIEGTAPNLPDGVKLNVTTVAGESSTEASFLMTTVSSGRFRVVKHFAHRTLAPLNYGVRIELILSGQRQRIRDLLRREWGLPRDARVMLKKETIQIGTNREQAAFRIETIGRLLWFLRVAQDCVSKAGEILAIPPPDEKSAWVAVMRGLAAEVQPTFSQPFSAYVGTYVVLHEKKALSTLRTAISELNPALTRHRKGKTSAGQARLERATAQLARLEEELLSRVPSGVKLVVAAPSKVVKVGVSAPAPTAVAPTALAPTALTPTAVTPTPSTPTPSGLSTPTPRQSQSPAAARTPAPPPTASVEAPPPLPVNYWPVLAVLLAFGVLVALVFAMRRSREG